MHWFGPDFVPLVESDSEDPCDLQHTSSSRLSPLAHLAMPEQSPAGQSVISSLHASVQEPTGRHISRGQAFSTSGPSQERSRASLRSSLRRQSSSTTSVPPHDEQASTEKPSTLDPPTRLEHSSSRSSFSTPSQANRTSSLANASIPSYLLPFDHPPKIPKTKRKRYRKLKPPKQASSHQRDEVDSPGRSSSSSPTPGIVIHAPAPQRNHFLARSGAGLLRFQSAPPPDAPHEGVERGFSTAPSRLGAGAQPIKQSKNRRTRPERPSLTKEAFSRRVFLVPKQPAPHRAASSGPNSVIAYTGHDVLSPPAKLHTHSGAPSPVGEGREIRSNTSTVAPTALKAYCPSAVAPILVPPPLDSLETVQDNFVVDSAIAYAPCIHESGSGGSDVTDVRKWCNVFQDLEEYKRFLALRGEDAQSAIDSIQNLLDSSFVDQRFKVILVVALSRLARKSERYPTRFFLHDVTCQRDTVTEGHFGNIHKGIFNKKIVCIKIFRYKISDTRLYLRALSREIMPWAQISHENVLPFYGIYPLGDESGRFGIISPFLENGNVIDFLMKFPNTDRRSLIFGVAAGMSHLHDNGLVHGDIKGRNILVTDTLPPRAVLADFGFATVTDINGLKSPDLSSNGGEGGTKQFEAPELFDPNVPYKRTEASDVYAFSMACYEILSGDNPFPGRRGDRVMIMVGRGERPSRPVGQVYQDRGFDDSMWDLIKHCWEQDAVKRPSAKNILQTLSKGFTPPVPQGWGDLSPSWFPNKRL